jgi:general stress protein 26
MLNKKENFLKTQKILRLSTVDENNNKHIVPVWYAYIEKKFYIGTNTRTKKAKNLKKNKKVSFCIDVGINAPNIFGVMGNGSGKLILEKKHVTKYAKKILNRYYKTLQNKAAQELLDDTNCIIQITPKKFSEWSF